VLPCVAVCCSVLQCVAVCCSVLQSNVVSRRVSACSTSQSVRVFFVCAVCGSALALQYVAVYCSVLQCVAVCCSM